MNRAISSAISSAVKSVEFALLLALGNDPANDQKIRAGFIAQQLRDGRRQADLAGVHDLEDIQMQILEDKIGETLDERQQLRGSTVALFMVLLPIFVIIVDLTELFDEDMFLGAEMGIKRTLGHTRMLHDIVDRHVFVTVLGKKLQCRLEYFVFRFAGLQLTLSYPFFFHRRSLPGEDEVLHFWMIITRWWRYF